jgi:hypothetical protein
MFPGDTRKPWEIPIAYTGEPEPTAPGAADADEPAPPRPRDEEFGLDDEDQATGDPPAE